MDGREDGRQECASAHKSRVVWFPSPSGLGAIGFGTSEGCLPEGLQARVV